MNELKHLAILADKASTDYHDKLVYEKASKALLRRLAKDLGIPLKGAIKFNPGGPVVSGEASLAWNDGSERGIYVCLMPLWNEDFGMVRRASASDKYGARSMNRWARIEDGYDGLLRLCREVLR